MIQKLKSLEGSEVVDKINEIIFDINRVTQYLDIKCKQSENPLEKWQVAPLDMKIYNEFIDLCRGDRKNDSEIDYT